MTSPTGPVLCSAKGCRAEAVHDLQWNNPKLHDAARRKHWTACDAHRESLSTFLSRRGFLRDVVPLAAGDEPHEPHDQGAP